MQFSSPKKNRYGKVTRKALIFPELRPSIQQAV